MAHSWGPGPIPGDEPRKRKRPKYGGEMDTVLDILYADAYDHIEKTDRVQALYPHATKAKVSSFVYDAVRAIAKGNDAHAERLTHKFIATAHRAAPEFEPEPRRSWWARFWPWLAFVYMPTAALLGACEVWK